LAIKNVVINFAIFVNQISDLSLGDYIGARSKHATYVPHTAGIYSKK